MILIHLTFDMEKNKSKCECKIKQQFHILDIKIDTDELYNKFLGKASSNFAIIKCFFYYLN